ncbi:MAG: mechanosensitive ion channel [Rhizobiaceae bacterium]|nr:mechanosensitive ion channel [Rhizobiaceae bacterium]
MDEYLKPEFWQEQISYIINLLLQWLQSPQFYAQVGAIVASVFLAAFLARTLRAKVSWFAEASDEASRFSKIRSYIYAVRNLLFPALCYVFLGIAASICVAAVGADWLVRIARSVSVVFLVYHLINQFITHPLMRQAMIYFAIPVATLQAFGYLDETIEFLDGVAFQAGNIRLSAYFIIKTALVAGFFFWLGSLSNKQGQTMIRNQESLDVGTKELFSKLFQIVLFAAVAVLAMQVLGLDLTILTVFGGALAVGIGFGLQQIASNFISGIILLIERSLTVGDFIELDDGRMGVLKELNMRSATLETFDGKELMVPNEKFITGVFINWTRDDPRQRYEVEFSVSYNTDIRALPDLIIPAISKHPGVLQEPEKPDLELRGFGDSGINFGLEFWIEGIDDGKNRISADLLMIIWETLRENNISIPFPQREVRLLESGPKMSVKRTTPGKPEKA